MRSGWTAVAMLTVLAVTGCADRAATPSPDAGTPAPGLALAALNGRAAHTVTTLADGRLLVAGGCVIDGCGDATAETFLVAVDGMRVDPGPAMTSPRDSHTATLVPDGRVVLVGGFAGEGQPPLASIDVFDPGAGLLTLAGSLLVGRGGHAAAVAGDGRVVITGGWTGPRRYASTTEIFDPRTAVVETGPDLPVAADALDALALADGRILVTGGQVRPGVATAAAAIFDPASQAWLEVGPMLEPRFKHTTVRLPDGSVLVMGGTADDVELLATTEVFDPVSGRFVPGPNLLEPRYKMPGGAVVLDDGRVAIAGGGRTVEVLDLATGISTVIATFAGRGSFATISRLASGDLLVVGGYDDRIRLRQDTRIIRLDGG